MFSIFNHCLLNQHHVLLQHATFSCSTSSATSSQRSQSYNVDHHIKLIVLRLGLIKSISQLSIFD